MRFPGQTALCIVLLTLISVWWPREIGAASPTASPFRWKDIAANTYAQDYKDTYDYAAASMAFVHDPARDTTLRGVFSASDLKPNFAYQMKLVGKPTAVWGPAGDDAANERIGYLGRWWRLQPNPGNSNDADYEAHRDDPAYIYEGYLLFSFFVSDSTGNAEVEVALDGSYHVLWWQDQRTPGACDSPVLWSTVIGHASHPAYAAEVGPTPVGVYAEIERNCSGSTTMPPGLYNCSFVVTEESFHQVGEDEGNWQSVLVDDTLQFEIGDASGVQPGESRSPFHTEPLQPNPFRSRTVWGFALPETTPLRFSVYDMSGRLVRDFPGQTYLPGRHQVSWDGRDGTGRQAPAGVYFFRIRNGDFSETGRMVLIK